MRKSFFYLFVLMGCLVFSSQQVWSQQKNLLQKSVQANIAGRDFTFITMQDPEVTDAKWHTIVVIDSSYKSGFRKNASSHPWFKTDNVTCNMLSYLREWLTEADNGVNGKFTKDHMPLAGAESQAMAVNSIADKYYEKDCPEYNETVCNRGGHKVNVCQDLESLRVLSLGINNEAMQQSKTGLKGKRYY
ncbi:MAG: hypothetical protein KDD46_06640 [Bdellovibrionales bacterium]|nr:hypothetical protein [Bdellovibrionales bacterium]